MSGEVVVSCAGGIDQCKALVKEVQNCLGHERRSMERAIDRNRRTIAKKFRYKSQAALNNKASVIIEAEWRIRAFELINRWCEHINANMSYLFSRRSDNEESSQNVVDDAISNLVHLAREFPLFNELCNLGEYLEQLCGERPASAEFHYLMRTHSDRDSQIENMLVQKIAYEQRWNLASGMTQSKCCKGGAHRQMLDPLCMKIHDILAAITMVYVKKKIFDKYRIIFQTLLFISEVISYGLNLTAENNIRILVPILVLSATCFLFINIPLIRRCPCRRKRTVRVISQIELVESSFSIFQLAADILKVAGHAESSSKVTETWVLVFAVIGYVLFLIKRNTNVDGGSSNRKGIRNWVKFSSFGSLWSRMIGKIKRGNSANDSGILEVEDKFEV